MGKPLSLGRKLRYPIKVTRLYKNPGDSFQKEDALFQYTYTWKQTVGDPFGEQWEETQVTPADWDSPAEGTLLEWKIHEGMEVDKDIPCAEIEEPCSHAVQFAGLCAICGKDMKETSWAADGVDADRATVQMIHDATLLQVSQDEASRAEERLQRRLLKHRKLSLVVDLDLTIIHTGIEPTIGQWRNDPSSPNYEALRDVKAFQMTDFTSEGHPKTTWYYLKLRPGTREFLAHMSELFELHVYTMGTRTYAQNVSKIIDPDRKLFGDRIISRDENGNLITKTLSRLFPSDTKMVVIMDDRADVWPRNRMNLIKVFPYEFFVGIGDINSSFLPKTLDAVPKVTAPTSDKSGDLEKSDSSTSQDTSEESPTAPNADRPTGADVGSDENRVSPLEGLLSMGGGDDPELRRLQAEEQEEYLEKQLKERPLLHLQEELDRQDDEATSQGVNGDNEDAAKNGEAGAEPRHHRHSLFHDDDEELKYLEMHLKAIHKAFFEEYDRALTGVQGGRVAHLRPGATKKMSLKDESADLKLVPDIGAILPRLKASVLDGAVMCLSGLVPLNQDVLASEITRQIQSFGGEVHRKVSRKLTHLVVAINRTRTHKVREAARYPHIKIVNSRWLMTCFTQWKMVDETPYLIDVQKEAAADDDSAAESSRSPSELGADDDAENEQDATANNEDAEDLEGVIPDELADPNSPIEEMSHFDWGSADKELEEFMGSEQDDDSESDTDSIDSNLSDQSRQKLQGKRKHDEAGGEDSEEESSLSKKQRLARSRTTGLKTVKTPNSADTGSSLPTPDITGEEEEDDDGEGDADEVDQIATADGEDGDDDDLEAEMMAEFEKEAWDEAHNDASEGKDANG